MPIGVSTSTLLRTGPTNPQGPSAARFIVAGVCPQGPTDKAVTVRSIAEFAAIYGDRSTVGATVFDQVQAYFGEGGTEAAVVRVVGPAAVASSLTVNDRAGTPQPTIKVSALSQGSWGDGLQVAISDGTSTGQVTLRVIKAGVTVETFADAQGPAGLAQATANSQYIRVTTLGSTTTDPSQARPAVTAATNLSGGNDDRASITATTHLTALNALAPVSFGPGCVAIPGYDVSQVGAGLIAHAKATDRVAILATTRTADASAATSTAQNGLTDGEYAGVFWPWVVAPEGSDTKVISPEGFVAGVRARAQSEVGVWQVPAGDRAAARFITGTVVPVDLALVNTLDAGRVNGIMTQNGRVALYNYRSVCLPAGDSQWKLLSSRDFVNSIIASIRTSLAPYIWSTVDGSGQALSAIEGAIVGVLQPLASQGGLYAVPDTVRDGVVVDDGDPGYSVEVDATAAQLADNTVLANVGVRLSPFAAQIRVQITKSNLTAPV